MAFITLPPPPPTSDRVHVIYTAADLWDGTSPQHQELIFSDPNDTVPRRLTMYTGELKPGSWADGASKTTTFQYPILGTFKDSAGSNVIGIIPISDPGEFSSAIANASLAICNAEDMPTWLNISSVAADVYQVELDSTLKIHAVVLSGWITVRNSVESTISYRVSVLERLTGNPPAQPPIFLGSGGWTGKYNPPASGAFYPVERPGIPQDKIGPGA
jgi:hypothetical protein